MAKVALSKQPGPKSKAKVFTHVECNVELESLGEGKMLCPKCHTVGYPLPIKK
jgi:hypothetical protein